MLIITPPSSRPPTVHQRAITAVPAHPLPGPAMIAHQKLCRWPRAGRRTSLTVQATSLPTVGLVISYEQRERGWCHEGLLRPTSYLDAERVVDSAQCL